MSSLRGWSAGRRRSAGRRSRRGEDQRFGVAAEGFLELALASRIVAGEVAVRVKIASVKRGPGRSAERADARSNFSRSKALEGATTSIGSPAGALARR